MTLLVFMLSAVVAIIVLPIVGNAQNKKSASNLGIILHEQAIHVEGVGYLETGINVHLFCYRDKLGFDTTTYKHQEHNLIAQKELQEVTFAKGCQDAYQLPYERIQKIELRRMSKLTDKHKSVLMRGVIGGSLAGTSGAIIGSMSGLKDTKIQKDFNVLVIQYKTKDNQEKKALFINDNPLSFRQLPKLLAEKIGQTEHYEKIGTQEL